MLTKKNKVAIINLLKGQKIIFIKENGASISKFCAGTLWGVMPKGDSVNSDLYFASLDSNKNTVEIIGLAEQWESCVGEMQHSGDDLVGEE